MKTKVVDNELEKDDERTQSVCIYIVGRSYGGLVGEVGIVS